MIRIVMVWLIWFWYDQDMLCHGTWLEMADDMVIDGSTWFRWAHKWFYQIFLWGHGSSSTWELMPGMIWKLCHLSLNLVVPIGQCFWVKAGDREPQFLCRKKRSTLKAAPNCWQLQPGSMLTQGTNYWSICHVLMARNSALFSTRNPRFFSGMLLTSMSLGWHFRVWVWPRGPWGVWNLGCLDSANIRKFHLKYLKPAALCCPGWHWRMPQCH